MPARGEVDLKYITLFTQGREVIGMCLKWLFYVHIIFLHRLGERERRGEADI